MAGMMGCRSLTLNVVLREFGTSKVQSHRENPPETSAVPRVRPDAEGIMPDPTADQRTTVVNLREHRTAFPHTGGGRLG